MNFGDSISINTDRIIYIENGPNYHTYTFSIERSNPSLNDPVENLLLAPLSDGSYKEFLVTYHLTQQEKEDIKNGYYFYSGNGTTVTELTAGSFNGNGQLIRQTCGWETRTGWNSCSSGNHDGSNYHDCEYLNNLSNGTPPTTYTYNVYICEQDDTIAPTNPGGSEGGGGGGTPCENCPPTEPNECIETPTDPTQPSTGIADDGGCIIGIPTLPNLPHPRNTPCEKTKTLMQRPDIKAHTESLDSQSKAKNEKGYNVSITGVVSPLIDGEEHRVNLGSATGQQEADTIKPKTLMVR